MSQTELDNIMQLISLKKSELLILAFDRDILGDLNTLRKKLSKIAEKEINLELVEVRDLI